MRQLGGAIGSLFLPGLGQALLRARRRAIVWVALFLATVLAVWFTVWALAPMLLVCLASAVDVFVMRAPKDRPLAWGDAGIVAAVLIVALGAVRAFVLEGFKIPSSSMSPTLVVGDHIFVDKLGPRTRGVEPGQIIVFTQPCDLPRQYVSRVVATGGQTVEVRCGVVYVNGLAVAAPVVNANAVYRDVDEYGETSREVHVSEHAEARGSHAYHVFHAPDGGHGHEFPTTDEPPSCGTDRGAAASAQQPGTVVTTKASAATCEPQRHYVVPAGHVFVMGDNRENANDSRYWGSVPVENVIGFPYGIWYSSIEGMSRVGGVQ